MKWFNNPTSIENRIFVYLCIFAATISMPKEISNTLLGFVLLGMIHRLILKHDDVRESVRRYLPLFIMVGLVWAAQVVSIVVHPDVKKHITEFIRVPFFYTAGLFAVVFCVKSRKRLAVLWILATLSILANDVYGVWEFSQNLPGLYDDYHDYQRYSGWLQYMVQATQITMWLPCGVMVFMWIISFVRKGGIPEEKARAYGLPRISGKIMLLLALAFLAIIAVAIGAFVANGTRGAWLASMVLIVSLSFLAARSKLKYFLVAICVGGLLYGVFHETVDTVYVDRLMSTVNVQDYSQQERVYVWTSALHMYEDNPMLGVGYGRFEEMYLGQYKRPEATLELGHAHNNFLQIMAEQGTVGLSANVLMILIGTFVGLRKYYRSWKMFGPGSLPAISALCFLAVLWAVQLHGLSEHTYGASITLKVFWFLMAVFYVYTGECIASRDSLQDKE